MSAQSINSTSIGRVVVASLGVALTCGGVVLGCADSDGTIVLPELTPIGVGDANCPAGGTRIRVGEDTNGNGVLDDDEVTQESVVCNQLDVEVLTRLTDVPAGSECEFGGQRIEVGLDNGDGGGTSGNSTLEDGEVDTSYLDCAEQPMVVEVEPPTGADGSFVLDLHGGAGGTGSGGSGGDIDYESDESSGGDAYLMLASNGTADASCTTPTLTVDLGATPARVSADLTLPVDPDETMLAEGALFVRSGNNRLFARLSGESVETTGLEVSSGATLTVPTTNGSASLSFSADVHIAGGVETATEDTNLFLSGEQVVVESSANVDTAASTSGVDGGNVTLSADQDMVFGGSIDTSGADAATGEGGDAGTVNLNADGALYASGTITASGGAGDDGGNGQSVFLRGDAREICNSANVTTDGGAGTQTGGNAGDVRFGEISYFGPAVHIRNSGVIQMRGGAQAGTCAATCSGGDGGDLELRTPGDGSITTTGSVDGRGGDANDGSGGPGGDLELTRSIAPLPLVGAPVTHHAVTGNIQLFGGAGTTNGGSGGDVEVENYGAPGSSVVFYGYASADLRGGASTSGSGGGGGEIFVAHVTGRGGAGLYVFADVNASGGASTSGNGGSGGGIFFYSLDSFGQFSLDYAPEVNFSLDADIVLDGGDGVQGGSGGDVASEGECNVGAATTGIRVAGSIQANGGDGTTGSGGRAGIVSLFARTTAEVGGTMGLAGGASTSGTGGSFFGSVVYGEQVTLSAAITAGAGAGTPNGSVNEDVALHSTQGASTVTGSVTGPSGGTAATLRTDSGAICNLPR